jgi:hypothetical protein
MSCLNYAEHSDILKNDKTGDFKVFLTFRTDLIILVIAQV